MDRTILTESIERHLWRKPEWDSESDFKWHLGIARMYALLEILGRQVLMFNPHKFPLSEMSDDEFFALAEEMDLMILFS